MYSHHHHSHGHDDEEIPLKRIDVSLRTLVSGPPSIRLLFRAEADDRKEDEAFESGTVSVNVTIGLNGQIEVTDLTGPWEDEGDEDGDIEMDDEEGQLTKRLRDQLKGVLETCEDLSIAIEWVVKWIQRWRKRKETRRTNEVEGAR